MITDERISRPGKLSAFHSAVIIPLPHYNSEVLMKNFERAELSALCFRSKVVINTIFSDVGRSNPGITHPYRVRDATENHTLTLAIR